MLLQILDPVLVSWLPASPYMLVLPGPVSWLWVLYQSQVTQGFPVSQASYIVSSILHAGESKENVRYDYINWLI